MGKEKKMDMWKIERREMSLLLAFAPSRNKEIYGSSRIKEVHKVSSGKIWYKICAVLSLVITNILFNDITYYLDPFKMPSYQVRCDALYVL